MVSENILRVEFFLGVGECDYENKQGRGAPRSPEFTLWPSAEQAPHAITRPEAECFDDGSRAAWR